jgi:lathosterol oxidase
MANPSSPLSVWLFTLFIDSARYLLAAGGAYLVFWVWRRERLRERVLFGASPARREMLRDIGWSSLTVLIFSLSGLAVRYGGELGYLRRYEVIAERGWLWFGATIVLLIVLQDAYFYFTHRAMHHRKLFGFFHRVHHLSTRPTPWSAYAFAPGEAVVHAAFVPLVWAVVPMHQLAVFAFLLFMITRNVLGHLSIELFPSGFAQHRLWGLVTTTTHHGMHHRRSNANYGLYFTFWDRVMGTTDARYVSEFEAVASRPMDSQGGFRDHAAKEGRPRET